MKKYILILLLVVVGWFGYRSEFDIGIVLDVDGCGMVYNNCPVFNYISYSGLGYDVGDIVLTYCLLNPLNTASDDIVIRDDVRLLHNVVDVYLLESR